MKPSSPSTTKAPAPPATSVAKPKLGKHPCGRKQVIATRNYKKLGHVKGQIKPCPCILCGPVEIRLQKWAWWGTHRYAGNYACHKCRAVVYTRGENPETMWCRDCYSLPSKGTDS